MDIYFMYALRMHLNFSLQYLLLLRFTGIWKFFAIFSKLHFYTNDITVQSIKETVTNRISSFFYSILMAIRWVI